MSKLYTRMGDRGETSLASGTRVGKDHPRLEAYGSIDELNAHLGMLQTVVPDPDEKERLTRIMKRVFIVSSTLAIDDPDQVHRVPQLLETDISELEQAMDRMTASLPPLRNFILPAGHPAVAQCHLARTVCRRAERAIIRLTRQVIVDPVLVRFINRLSDYLFILARKSAYDLGVGETTWSADFRDSE